MMVSVAGAMVKVRLTVLVCWGLLESFTWNARGVLVTLTVGVPVIAPVEALSERPVGRVPLAKLQVNGVVPPVAASVAL